MKKQSKKKRRLFFKIFFSFLVLLVSLEVGLQVVHVLAARLRAGPELSRPGAPVILCVGDSHTYGTSLPEDKSYPSQLEEILIKRGIETNVINMGIPGQNTSELRRGLPELMERYDPQVVLILICANNDWNRTGLLWSDLQDGKIESGFKTWLLKAWYKIAGSLRTVRLVRYLIYNNLMEFEPNEKEADRHGGVHFHHSRFGTEDWQRAPELADRSMRDLCAIVDTVRGHGASPVFLNYPAQPFAPMDLANYFIERAAKTRSVPLVNVEEAIKPIFWKSEEEFDKEARDRIFLDSPEETHLDGTGYRIVARETADLLLEQGLLEGHSSAGREGPP